MSERFLQPVDAMSRPEAERPVTSYRRLLKRLGLEALSQDAQRAAVEKWLAHQDTSGLPEALIYSLEHNGISTGHPAHT